MTGELPISTTITNAWYGLGVNIHAGLTSARHVSHRSEISGETTIGKDALVALLPSRRFTVGSCYWSRGAQGGDGGPGPRWEGGRRAPGCARVTPRSSLEHGFNARLQQTSR